MFNSMISCRCYYKTSFETGLNNSCFVTNLATCFNQSFSTTYLATGDDSLPLEVSLFRLAVKWLPLGVEVFRKLLVTIPTRRIDWKVNKKIKVCNLEQWHPTILCIKSAEVACKFRQIGVPTRDLFSRRIFARASINQPNTKRYRDKV